MLDNKYMTKKEVCDYLEINDNYKSIKGVLQRIKSHFKLNLIEQDVNGKIINVYHRHEIIDISKRVLNFFDKHYTKRVAEEKIGEYIKYNRFDKVDIPKGYTLIMKTTTGSKKDLVAYEKSIIDSYYESKKKIDEGYYMTKKEVCDYLEITDNYAEITINELFLKIRTCFNLNVTKQKVNGIMTEVYYRDEIVNIAKEVLSFFDKHYTKRVAEEKIGENRKSRKFEKIKIPNGYTSIMKTTTGTKKDCIAYKKDAIDSYCEIQDKIKQGYYISRKNTLELLNISLHIFVKNKKDLDEIFFNSEYYYEKSQIENIILPEIKKINLNTETYKYKDSIPEDFIPRGDVINLFNIDINKKSKKFINDLLKKISDGFKIDAICVKDTLFYKKHDVLKSLDEVNSFKEIYYSKEQFSKKLSESSLPNIGINNMTIVNVPSHYRSILKLSDNNSSWFTAIEKSDVDKYIENLEKMQSKVKNEEYVKIKDSMILLNVSREYLHSIIFEYEIDTFKYLNCLYINKNHMLNIKKRRDNFFKKYITVQEAKNIYFNGDENITIYFKRYLKSYKVPLFAYTKDNCQSLTRSGNVLKISEVKDLKTNLINIRREELLLKQSKETIRKRTRKAYINYDLEGETYLDTFKLRLYEKWDGFSNHSSSTDEQSYTNEKWFEFIESKINAMRCDRKVSNAKINSYISCTRALDDMLNYFKVDEVYELTSNNINTYFNIINCKTTNQIIYDFLGRVSNDIDFICKKKNSKKRGFNMENIFSPYNTDAEQRKLSSYKFETYSELFKYSLNLGLHIEKSIDEIVNHNTAKYASTWLYCMLHLNNAWRHGDVTRFPKLDLNQILIGNKINNYSWFKNNKVSLEMSKLVISKILKWELVISKTQTKGSFFCSDELSPSLASCILLLSLYHEKNNHVCNVNTDPLMYFNTEYNRPTEKNLNTFFSNLDIEGFKFSSLRMNKTVMTLLYYLANLQGDSKALVYAQKLRSHLDKNSPLNYIDIDINDLELLTRHLFSRGEFGYITSLLVSRLKSNDKSPITFAEMTEEIIQINGLFGELSGAYNTVGFLNNLRHERQLIIDTLAEKSLKECQVILTDIFTKKLPSRMDNIQCLISKEGCYKTSSNEEEASCFTCPYHIPSIYALTALCESLRNDFAKFYETTSKIKQFKLCLSIDRKITLINEAVSQYGQEYVFNCLGISEKEFMEIIQEIPEPKEFNDINYIGGI